MDFLFVPGKSAFENGARSMLELKPNMQLVPTSFLITEVDDFIDEAEKLLTSANEKLNALYVSSHANDRGQFFIELDDDTARDSSRFISFENLEGVNTRKSIRIDSDRINPRPKDAENNPIPAFFYIKGCRIGNEKPYLNLLKTALGGDVNVNAPKFLHGLFPFNGKGFVEFFSYAFSVSSKTEIKKLSDIRTAFRDKNFTFYEGTAIPDNLWNKWIKQTESSRHNVRVKFKPAIQIPNSKKKESGIIGKQGGLLFKNRGTKFLLTNGVKDYGAATPPTEHADRLQVARTFFQNLALFKSTHAYPFYERYGYSSFNDFFDGLNWTFSVRDDSGSNILVARGGRFEYEVRHPITRIIDGKASKELIFNFYPKPFDQSRYIQDPLLLETNTQFFQTV